MTFRVHNANVAVMNSPTAQSQQAGTERGATTSPNAAFLFRALVDQFADIAEQLTQARSCLRVHAGHYISANIVSSMNSPLVEPERRGRPTEPCWRLCCPAPVPENSEGRNGQHRSPRWHRTAGSRTRRPFSNIWEAWPHTSIRSAATFYFRVAAQSSLMAARLQDELILFRGTDTARRSYGSSITRTRHPITVRAQPPVIIALRILKTASVS
jgi:hypothetical protein